MSPKQAQELAATICALQPGESIQLPQPIGNLPLPMMATVTARSENHGVTLVTLQATLLDVFFAELILDVKGTDILWRITP